MSSLRSVVVGAGMIGRVHARAIRASGAELVTVIDADADRQRQINAELGTSTHALSLDQVLDDPRVEVLHVCVPNAYHAELVERALAAGKHVVCEKPLATDLVTATRLVGRAQAAGVVTAIPFVYRFFPAVREARARVAAGAVGRVHTIHATYLQDWLLDPHVFNWRRDPAVSGPSGTFADIGSHLADVVEFVSGHRISEVASVATVAVPVRYDDGTASTFGPAGAGGTERRSVLEDGAAVVGRTDQGAMVSLLVSQVAAGHRNTLSFEIDGTEGSLSFTQDRFEVLSVGSTTDVRSEERDPSTWPAARRYMALPPGHPQGLQDCFNGLVADAYQAVTSSAPDGLPTFADGLRSAAVAEAVATAAASNSWAVVDEVATGTDRVHSEGRGR